MSKHEENLGRHIAQAMLSHPETVVVVDADGCLCLTYQDQLQTAEN